MESMKKEAEAIKPSLIACRRRLHAFAECGFSLPKTLAFIKNALQNIGYEPKECGKAGLVCELAAKDPHAPTLLLRADMDALPLKEETHLPFRAENGCMHACGHDMHTAMLLGAAALLKKREGSLSISVRFAFQGAEEILSGAKDMLDAGLLLGIDAALMVHVVTALPLQTGTVLLPPPGIGAPAARFFSIEVLGKSAHVGAAGGGVDALKAAISLYREMHAAKDAVGGDLLLSVGRLVAGDAPNIVPQKAVIEGTFRTKEEERMRAFEKELSSLCAKTHGEGDVRLHLLGGCPPLKNDAECLASLAARLPQCGFSTLQTEGSEGSAAEDFAVLAAGCPAVSLALAAGQREHGYDYPLHHPRVLFDEDALPVGAALYAVGALALGEGLLQTFTNGKGA